VTKKVGNKDFLATTIIVVILGVAAIVTALVIKARAPKDDGSYVPREVEITPEIELLQEYVRLRTTAGHELEGAEFLRNILTKNGIESTIIESAPGRANLYARIRGESESGGLLLLHHIDVMPADPAKWSEPPFAANITNSTLYGRGTLDIKGIGICHLAAFLDVAKSGRTPKHDLVFLAVADEEGGSHLGMEWLVRNRPELFQGIGFAITEGGITEVVREKLKYFAVQNGEKIFFGFQLHGKAKEDVDAAKKDLQADFDKKVPDRIIPDVRQYFSAIAPSRLVGGDILADIDASVANGKFGELDANYRMLTQNNLLVGDVVEHDGSWDATGTASILPDEDPHRFAEKLQQRVAKYDVGLDTHSYSIDRPTGISPTDTPFFRVVADAVHSEYGADVTVGPYIFPRGGTDCRFLRSSGIDCYGVVPFLMDFYQSQTIHHQDERVRLDWYVEGVELTRDLVERYEFGDPAAR